MRLLLVEDDFELSRVISRALRDSEFAVDTASDGVEGLFKAQNEDYDVIILDLMLPRMDGSSVLRKLRQTKKTPVLILTARDAAADRIDGLNMGADDYVTKPFDLEELVARIRALVRRSSNHPNPIIELGDIKVDTASREVFRSDDLVPLTAKEYTILHLLLMRRGELVSRAMIYDRVYGEQDDSLSNVVDVYIANIRKRLGAELIETRRGEGYIIRA